jgi:hypothetical protein
VYLNFTPVPEPTGIVLSVATAGLFAVARRRRKNRIDVGGSEPVDDQTQLM